MLISTLNLEAKALKAFREEPETDSDEEEDHQLGNGKSGQPGSEIELGNY